MTPEDKLAIAKTLAYLYLQRAEIDKKIAEATLRAAEHEYLHSSEPQR